MRDCISESTLQAWFDGELPADANRNVAAHLNLCLQCAEAARTLEAENRVLSEGLAAEFTAPIPTERLRKRVETAVAALDHPRIATVSQSRWRLSEFLSFRNLAYASIATMILLAGFIGFVYLKKPRATTVTTVKNRAPGNFAVIPNQPAEPPPMAIEPLLPTKRTVHATKLVRRSRAYEPDAMSLSWQQRQYDYAIAKLNEAIKVQPPMRPALQVEYEYNMAVIDNTIAAGRDAARRKPTDPQAAQLMRDAYQSKVDLMNQIANARLTEK